MNFDGSAATPALAQDEAAPRALTIVGQALCVLVPLAIWFMPVDIDPTTKHGLAIAMFMVPGWITQAMDYTVTGLIGCFLFWALGIVRFQCRVLRLRQRHRLVPVLGAPARRDRDALRRRAPARLHGDAAHRDHLSADFAGPHRHRLPAHLHRAVGRRPPRHHGGGRARPRRGVPRPDRQQRRPRHVPHTDLHGQHLRQDDHRRRRLDHRARPDREGRRRRGAVERMVPGVPAVQHSHRARGLVADVEDVSARGGEPPGRPRLSARRAQEDGTVVGTRESRRCCSASRWRCGSPISSTTSRRR